MSAHLDHLQERSFEAACAGDDRLPVCDECDRCIEDEDPVEVNAPDHGSYFMHEACAGAYLQNEGTTLR